LAIAWIAAGVLLLAIELHNVAFYAAFAAVGCFAAAVVAVAAPDTIVLHLVAAVVVTAAGILVVRPRVARPSVHGGHRGRGIHGGFVGHEVVTLDVVGDAENVGHVQLAGERWRAVSGNDEPLPTGTRVVITGVEGTTLIVWPAEGYLPVEGADDDPLEGER
jgi:membrane protein implicated in regulation of membrane protease activity